MARGGAWQLALLGALAGALAPSAAALRTRQPLDGLLPAADADSGPDPALDYENNVYQQHQAEMAQYNAWLATYEKDERYTDNYRAWADRQRSINKKAYKL